MGVPTHYQNDGSYLYMLNADQAKKKNLYMLTPVVSPPSADSVSRWLLHGDSGQKSDAAAMESSSPKGSSGSQIGSQGSWVESCRKSIQEECSRTWVGISQVYIMDKLKQQIRGDLNAEMNPFVKEVTGKQAHGDLNGLYRSESDSTKEKKIL